MQYMQPPSPLKGRSSLLVGALVAGILVDAMALVFESIHLGILQDLDAGVDVSADEVDASDVRTGIAYLGQSLTYIVTVIVFLTWFSRAYRNLPRLGLFALRYTPGWAIGSWFVPFLNLFRPKQIANDLWRGSEPAPGPKTLAQHPTVPALVHWWWAVWILSSLVGNADARVYLQAETVPEQISASSLGIVGDVVYIASGIVTILFVRAMTRRQEEAIQVASSHGGPFYPTPPSGYGDHAMRAPQPPLQAQPPYPGQPQPGQPQQWHPPAPPEQQPQGWLPPAPPGQAAPDRAEPAPPPHGSEPEPPPQP